MVAGEVAGAFYGYHHMNIIKQWDPEGEITIRAALLLDADQSPTIRGMRPPTAAVACGC